MANAINFYDINLIEEFDELNLLSGAERMQLNEYCKHIEDLASSKISTVTTTNIDNEAAIIASILFLNSKHNLRIYINGLDDRISKLSIWYKAIENVVTNREDIKVEVLFEQIPSKCSVVDEFLGELRQAFPKKVFLSKIRTAELENISTINFHFIVGDSNKFLFSSKESTNTVACNFNDPETSSKLIALFTLFKGYSIPHEGF